MIVAVLYSKKLDIKFENKNDKNNWIIISSICSIKKYTSKEEVSLKKNWGKAKYFSPVARLVLSTLKTTITLFDKIVIFCIFLE